MPTEIIKDAINKLIVTYRTRFILQLISKVERYLAKVDAAIDTFQAEQERKLARVEQNEAKVEEEIQAIYEAADARADRLEAEAYAKRRQTEEAVSELDERLRQAQQVRRRLAVVFEG